jgi:hypothetical protein
MLAYLDMLTTAAEHRCGTAWFCFSFSASLKICKQLPPFLCLSLSALLKIFKRLPPSHKKGKKSSPLAAAALYCMNSYAFERFA